MDKSVIKDLILGNVSVEFYVAFYIFVFIGLALSILLHVKGKSNKVKKSGEQFKFDWKFFIKDNTIRALINVIVVFALVRFYSELKESIGFEYELNMFLGFVAGTSLDRLIMLFKKKLGLKTTK